MDRTDARFDEVIVRVGAVEQCIAALKVDFAARQVRLDNVTRKLERIDRRLELTDAPV